MLPIRWRFFAGLERGLYKRDDYERFAGNLVKIKTRAY